MPLPMLRPVWFGIGKSEHRVPPVNDPHALEGNGNGLGSLATSSLFPPADLLLFISL